MTTLLIGLTVAAAAFLMLLVVGMCRAAAKPWPEYDEPTPEWLAELHEAVQSEEANVWMDALEASLMDAIGRVEAAQSWAAFNGSPQSETPIHDQVAVEQMRAELDDDATVRRLFADD